MLTCPHCDYAENPPHALTCAQCRLELPLTNPQPISSLPQYKQKQKMAVFDLDKTLFDLSRRERVAKRAGHNLGTPAAWAEMNKPQHISKDEPIEGTVELVNELAKEGYVIAYLTGRPNNLRGPTREHLQRSGYPVHRGKDGELLFMAPVPGRYDPSIHFRRLVAFKSDILTRLSSSYDLTFYFDDTQEFRDAAMSVRPRIPAVYSSVSDYTSNREGSRKSRRQEKPAASNPGSSQESGTFTLPSIPTLSKSEMRRLQSAAKIAHKTMKVEMKAFQMDVPGDEWSKYSDSELPDTNPRKTGAEATSDIEFKDMIAHKVTVLDHRRLEPFGYSMNLLKRIKSYNHEGREYMGLFDAGTSKLHVGTGFGVGSVGPADSVLEHLKDNDVPIMFHTHPTRRNDLGWIKGFDWFNPSLPDHGFTMWTYLFYGVTTHIVSQKKGMHFLRPYIRPRSKLATLLKKKKLTKKEKEEVVKLVEADFKAMSKLYRSFWKRFVAMSGMNNNQMMDLEQVGDITTSIVNSDLKSMKFQHDYYTYPLMAVQYKADGDGLKAAYKGIRSNPSDPSCPLATQDLEVNTKNRDAAIAAEHIKYGPLNLNDEAYWARYAEKWGTTPEVAKKSNCSNCIAFDISPRMKDCMPGKTSDDEGELGYCWMHHFKCHSARTCNTWAAGGPIDLDKVSLEWQERSSQVKSNPISRPRKKRAKTGKMKREPASKYFNRLMSELHKEFPDNSQRAAVALSYVEKEYGKRGVESVTKSWSKPKMVKSNPGGTTVEEAKKMYKQFHQSEPSSVSKKKVDFGDTWVGLGKAWSIGYRSPKETGSKEQKYIHHFGKDEDTGKTFEEPELYYVKNKDGSTMMVIMGGDWYIDVDSDGEVSWIYI